MTSGYNYESNDPYEDKYLKSLQRMSLYQQALLKDDSEEMIARFKQAEAEMNAAWLEMTVNGG